MNIPNRFTHCVFLLLVLAVWVLAACTGSPSAPPQGEEAEALAELKVKKALEATDPSSVQLASGDVQLVEFFAFW